MKIEHLAAISDVPNAMQRSRGIARLALFAAGWSLFASPPTGASEASRLYAPCAACHAAEAWGSLDGRVPSLAGQRRQYLETRIALFQSAATVDTASQHVGFHPAFDNQQKIVMLAQYLSALPVNPQPVEGGGDNLQVGRELNDRICAGCHSTGGKENPDNPAPRIAGQQYPYLRRRIEEGAALRVDLAPPEMTGALRGMTKAQQDAVADYLSRAPAMPGAPERVIR